LLPNAWNLYDKVGNVWEWFSDLFGNNSSTAQVDPQGPSSGEDRVLRGGAWLFNPGYLRVSNCYWSTAGSGYNGLGFCCVQDLE